MASKKCITVRKTNLSEKEKQIDINILEHVMKTIKTNYERWKTKDHSRYFNYIIFRLTLFVSYIMKQTSLINSCSTGET